MHARTTTTLIFMFALAACGPSPNAPGVGGVTKAQAEELNQSAAQLDERSNEADPPAKAH